MVIVSTETFSLRNFAIETSLYRMVVSPKSHFTARILLKGPLHHRMDGVLKGILPNGPFTEHIIVSNGCSAE